MNEALDALQQNYFYLTDNLDDLLDCCQTDAQKQQLKADYQQATANFYQARNKIFQANDAGISQAVTQLKAAQTSLEKMTQELASAASVINAITTAVKIGTELAAMAK